ncbi:hypothetical protein M231_06681 [Tremella mesenterica]|uniref:HSF-type DNA-binding domain-containing protein n=1 Tax=Tremella mesenterica TaxID=5217 RepID=A0A4Q1BG71_TREME|nr:hypothetical protein M231_06681 [Tremella mesenterica]
MTTNLNAIAGPSRNSMSPKVEPDSPNSDLAELSEPSQIQVTKGGISVGEDGEVVKVPAFLTKLFTMVSDLSTNELIYWSESGDSFFVPDSERFGKELLPRFFKHSNFSSFVRQLNMYGFHKVPHLQSGVLKHDSPSELWEFINPFFKRDQQQLLSRVTRKNNRPMPTSATTSGATRTGLLPGTAYPVHLITDGTTEGEIGQVVGTTGQIVDLAAITNGIAAIRQTQASIGADLKRLQNSNDMLWREAMEQQKKHQKHQETIDMIVVFLERLFGTEGQGLKGLKEAMRRGGYGRDAEPGGSDEPRKRRRLGIDRMIGDGHEAERDPNVMELPNDPYPVARFMNAEPGISPREPPPTAAEWPSASQRFTALPTDEDPPSSRVSLTSARPVLSPLSDVEEIHPVPENAVGQYLNIQPNLNTGNLPPLSPTSAAQAAQTFNLDPALLQTTIGSLLQSPAAAQMFLNSLNASAQGQALQSPTRGKNAVNVRPSPPLGDNVDPTLALFSPFPNQSLMNNQNQLLKTYQDAVAVNGGVDELQESIDALVRNMGLDLPKGGQKVENVQPFPVEQMGQVGQTGVVGQGGEPGEFEDFNIDEFLNELAKNGPEGDPSHPV